MAEAVSRKKKVCAGLRLHLSAFTKVITLLENLDSKRKINKLQAHKKTLQEQVSILNALDKEILNGLQEHNGDTVEKEISDAGELNCAINKVLESIESALEVHMALNTTVSSSPVDLNAIMSFPPGTQPPPSVTETVSCKLPKLTLKPFNGETSPWFAFWDSFDCPSTKTQQSLPWSMSII